MTFRAAVKATPDIQNAWRSGLQALRRADRGRIDAEDTRRIAGSVDLDASLRNTHPNASRWDYAIGYRMNGRREMVYWIEVHPANDGEIDVVLRKLAWLNSWLRNNAPRLEAMEKVFVWISSGRTSFTQNSPQAKRLASHGIRHAGRGFQVSR